MKPEIEKYIKASHDATILEGKSRAFASKCEDRMQKIEKKFNVEIKKLEKERDNLTNIEEEKQTKKTNILSEKITIQKEIVNTFERKMSFIKKKKEIEKTVIPKTFKLQLLKPCIKNFGTVYEDKYMILKLYGKENDRPKNKFTLFVVGICSLREFLDEYMKDSRMIRGVNLNVWEVISHFSTIESMENFVKKRTLLPIPLLGTYRGIKEEYLAAIESLSEKDLRILSTPKQVTEKQAPFVCIIKNYQANQKLRIYEGFYYSKIKSKSKTKISITNHIQVKREIYERYCIKEKLRIVITGNIAFGNWYSLHIKSWREGVIFNKKNFEKELDDAIKFVKKEGEGRKNKISFSPPKVIWEEQ